MANIINNLHSYLVFEILSYLIDGFDYIKFRIHPYPQSSSLRCVAIESNYNGKYEMLMINKDDYLYKKVWCKNKIYTMSISCIKKKKEINHRYYLTFMVEHKDYVACNCGYRDCQDRQCMDYLIEESYTSIYISNDINKVILLWYSIPEYSILLKVCNPGPIVKIINQMNKKFVLNDYDDCGNDFDNERGDMIYVS
jgi:hypothetical protein